MLLAAAARFYSQSELCLITKRIPDGSSFAVLDKWNTLNKRKYGPLKKCFNMNLHFGFISVSLWEQNCIEKTKRPYGRDMKY